MAVKTKTKAAKAAKTPRDGGKTEAKTAPKAGNSPHTVRLGQFRRDPPTLGGVRPRRGLRLGAANAKG